MGWLAKFDARSALWPTPVHLSYLALKWFLVALGAYLIVGLAFVEISEHRVGLGTGTVIAVLFGIIKGLTTAATSPPPDSSAR